MGKVFLCALLWAAAAAAVVQCVRRWRSGADQMWSAKWKALAGALIVAAFPVMATARLLPPGAQLVFEDAGGLLAVGSVCAMGAGWAAAHRSEAQTRAVRSGLGLPVEKRLWSPWVLMGLWSIAGFPFTLAAVLVAGRYVEAYSAPAADGTWAEARMVGWLSVLGIGGFVAIGMLHGLIQHQRRTREQQRVREAEQHYLATTHCARDGGAA
ncbi:hypothetical protein ACFQ67_21085 [Streptomyces sp. NPDC056488]|uniref:hypothetical protein n=1 Tax=Streptomyces sp. NPDC056488 TaxID=3345836 RepID=UPI00368A121D